MKKKLTSHQKEQIRVLRVKLAIEARYIIRGQGDGINQYLTIKNIHRDITSVKHNPDFKSNRI